MIDDYLGAESLARSSCVGFVALGKLPEAYKVFSENNKIEIIRYVYGYKTRKDVDGWAARKKSKKRDFDHRGLNHGPSSFISHRISDNLQRDPPGQLQLLRV